MHIRLILIQALLMYALCMYVHYMQVNWTYSMYASNTPDECMLYTCLMHVHMYLHMHAYLLTYMFLKYELFSAMVCLVEELAANSEALGPIYDI